MVLDLTSLLPATGQGRSLAERLAALPAEQREYVLGAVPSHVLRRLLWDWRGFWARPNQLPPPGDWFIWLLQAGRGFGKTRSGAEAVNERVWAGTWRHFGMVGRTSSDVRDTMVEGPSGVIAASPPWFRPVYEPTRARVVYPNGAVGKMFSAAEPDLLRGPDLDGGWGDEVAAWRFRAAWDNLKLAVRVGKDPRIIATTTPKPVPVIRELQKDSATAVTRGLTWENVANLSPKYIEQVVRPLIGTRLGRQELEAILLEDVQGAQWTSAVLEACRVTAAPTLDRIVVGVDPPGTSGEEAAECGIIIGGAVGRELLRHGYLLEDASLRGTPHEWALQVVSAYHKWQADAIVAEVNNGGDMVEHTIRTVDPMARVITVRASRGKAVRAEPVAGLYQQKRCHHVGFFAELEDQQRNWVPGETSPDRLDAAVWVFTELFGLGKDEKVFGRDFGMA